MKWIFKHRWWIIGLNILLFFLLEAFDFLLSGPPISHIFEFIFYMVFLVIIGVLLDRLSQTLAAQDHTIHVLDQKHRVSLELMAHEDWPELLAHLTNIPGSIADMDETCLYLNDPITGLLEKKAEWVQTGKKEGALAHENACIDCMKTMAASGSRLTRCEHGPTSQNHRQHGLRYSWLIKNQDFPLALIQMRLKPGSDLSATQRIIFESINDELAMVLKSSLERRSMTEYRIAEKSLAEKRELIHYLHDTLSQDLAFLRLKLDQAIREKDRVPVEILAHDLKQMLSAANDSYNIVRNTIEITSPETRPLLANLLIEHARSVAKQAGFTLNFQVDGTPQALLPDAQREIFYIFREVLNNILAHARASKVDILMEWCEESGLHLAISDDGIGFTPLAIEQNKHFGLSIMAERISKLAGQMNVTSSENAGTTISITVPRAVPNHDREDQKETSKN